MAEGAKGGQFSAKPIIVHPGLLLSSSKKPLHFAQGEIARELLVVSPPMAPESVPVLVPTCARVDSGRCQQNDSVAAEFFSYMWKNYFKNGKKVKEAEKTIK